MNGRDEDEGSKLADSRIVDSEILSLSRVNPITRSLHRGARRERVVLFAGGDFCVNHLAQEAVDERDECICVDRGLEHCLAARLQPSLLIGDFDSVDERLLQLEALADVPRLEYPPKKASSDLELALELLLKEPPASVLIVGVSGGRTDHMLFNWLLTARHHWPFALTLLDGTTRCRVLQGRAACEIEADAGQTLSLLALVQATGVSTSGLQYALQEASLEVGSTRGLSNVVERNPVRVSMRSGTLLILLNNSDSR